MNSKRKAFALSGEKDCREKQEYAVGGPDPSGVPRISRRSVDKKTDLIEPDVSKAAGQSQRLFACRLLRSPLYCCNR
jgi:hypothetical protein